MTTVVKCRRCHGKVIYDDDPKDRGFRCLICGRAPAWKDVPREARAEVAHYRTLVSRRRSQLNSRTATAVEEEPSLFSIMGRSIWQ